MRGGKIQGRDRTSGVIKKKRESLETNRGEKNSRKRMGSEIWKNN